MKNTDMKSFPPASKTAVGICASALLSLAAEGAVTITSAGGDEDNKDFDFNYDGTTLTLQSTVSNDAIIGEGGSITGSGIVTGGDFGWTVVARSTWDTVTAEAELGDFGAYFTTLTTIHQVRGDGSNGRLNATGGNNNQMSLGQVLVFEFQTSGDVGILIESFGLANYTGSEEVDFVFWDSGTNSVISSGFNVNANSGFPSESQPNDRVAGPAQFLTTGDRLFIGHSGSDFRVADISFDLVAIPEPSTFTLVGLASLAFAGVRRRA